MALSVVCHTRYSGQTELYRALVTIQHYKEPIPKIPKSTFIFDLRRPLINSLTTNKNKLYLRRTGIHQGPSTRSSVLICHQNAFCICLHVRIRVRVIYMTVNIYDEDKLSASCYICPPIIVYVLSISV